jgi:hypothetical protein
MALLRTSLVIWFVAALVGCADSGGQTLVVLNNAVPDEGCVVAPSEGGLFLPSGRIDAVGVTERGSSVGYLITPTIKNLADSQDDALTTERTVILQGAKIDLVVGTHADGTALLSDAEIADLNRLNQLKFTAPFSGAIEPDGGLVGIAFELVPRGVIAAIGPKLATQETALITASFAVFGRTISGSGVEADAFVYSISVCNGCLFTDLGSCLGIPDQTYPGGGACNLFQDSPATCCQSSGGSVLVCPAEAETL